jgi:hypothetical protein
MTLLGWCVMIRLTMMLSELGFLTEDIYPEVPLTDTVAVHLFEGAFRGFVLHKFDETHPSQAAFLVPGELDA